jgi:cytochrome b pre-mRNA-processing protein 3
MFQLFRRSANRRLIDRLHGEIVAAARDPVLFADYGITDDFEGRFESVTLHAAVILRHLNVLPEPGPSVAQDLADAVVKHFEVALREMGVGDTTVPKRMKKLVEAFLGRSSAYDRALKANGADLAATLSRNVYAGARDATRLAAYVAALDAALAASPLPVLLAEPLPIPRPATVPAKAAA